MIPNKIGPVTDWFNFQSAAAVANGEAACTPGASGTAQAGWSGAANVLAAGGGEAHIAQGYGNPFDGQSNFLRALDLAVPFDWLTTGCVILGIEMRAKKRFTTLNNSAVEDCHVRVVKGGAIRPAERAVAGAWPNAYVTHGGPTDLWGESWTIDDIKSPSFGFAIASHWIGSIGASDGFIDHIQARIYFEQRGFFLVL